MKVKEIENKERWEGFLKQCEQKTFLDSWNWGTFKQKMDKEVWRLGILAPSEPENSSSHPPQATNELVGVAQVIKINAKRGTFLYVPHGPVVKPGSGIKGEIIKTLREKLKELAGEQGASFLRIDPIWERSEETRRVFKEAGFRDAPIFIHPNLTLELNLEQPERGLLKNMRKSTRRSIRKADQEGVETFKSKDINDLSKFFRLYDKVVDRQNFVPFSRDYIKKEFSTFLGDDQILSIFSRYKGEVLGAAIVVFWQDKAFYHHGASDLKYDVSISHPIQWEAIKEAKERNCKSYNFWGVAPEDASDDHPYSGLTMFKTGFGGERKKYVETQDFPFSPLYWFTYLFEKLRKKKRNL